jgi:hypothetical protein
MLNTTKETITNQNTIIEFNVVVSNSVVDVMHVKKYVNAPFKKFKRCDIIYTVN